MLQPRRNTVFIYSQKAADRILDRSTRQHDTGTSHVTGETNQRVLAAVCICTDQKLFPEPRSSRTIIFDKHHNLSYVLENSRVPL